MISFFVSLYKNVIYALQHVIQSEFEIVQKQIQAKQLAPVLLNGKLQVPGLSQSVELKQDDLDGWHIKGSVVHILSLDPSWGNMESVHKSHIGLDGNSSIDTIAQRLMKNEYYALSWQEALRDCYECKKNKRQLAVSVQFGQLLKILATHNVKYDSGGLVFPTVISPKGHGAGGKWTSKTVFFEAAHTEVSIMFLASGTGEGTVLLQNIVLEHVTPAEKNDMTRRILNETNKAKKSARELADAKKKAPKPSNDRVAQAPAPVRVVAVSAPEQVVSVSPAPKPAPKAAPKPAPKAVSNPPAEVKGRCVVTKEIPDHWGSAPISQVRDYVQHPDGYGCGSSTKRDWILTNLDMDAQAKISPLPVLLNGNFVKPLRKGTTSEAWEWKQQTLEGWENKGWVIRVKSGDRRWGAMQSENGWYVAFHHTGGSIETDVANLSPGKMYTLSWNESLANCNACGEHKRLLVSVDGTVKSKDDVKVYPPRERLAHPDGYTDEMTVEGMQGKWMRKEIGFEAQQRSAKIKFEVLSSDGKGTVLLDDVRLEPMPVPKPVPAPPAPARRPGSHVNPGS